MSNPHGHEFRNLSADSPEFEVHGGWYGLDYVATWSGGSFTLKKKALDGTTFVTALTAVNTNDCQTARLPPGTYKWVKTGSPTAAFLNIVRIPESVD